MMKNVNIAMIPKPGKPNSHSISNQRKIFILSIFRSILMKILLKDEYKMIDEFMSDSNVGGRKGRRPFVHNKWYNFLPFPVKVKRSNYHWNLQLQTLFRLHVAGRSD